VPKLETAVASIDAALQDADVQLTTDLGDRHEVTSARLWRGQVLIDWEPDAQAGDCLLRASLLRRLIEAGAQTRFAGDDLLVQAPGRIVAALSSEHAALVRQLGGARRIEMLVRLRFDNGVYVGGQETYSLVQRGRHVPLLRLTAEVKVRTSRATSQRTSPAPR
jgi:hypothetical protein